MTHRTEDELLAYALEVVDSDEERDAIAAHVAECPECRQRLEHLRQDIEVIGGVRPRRQVLRTPYPRQRLAVAHGIIRAAALVVLGFLVGLGASSWAGREPVFLSRAYVELSPPDESLTAYTVSDATDVPIEYYEDIAERTE
jgi:hypothetical protein